MIRHAEADNIVIKAFTKEENGKVVIDISDDGRGIAPGAKNGRGLGNMSHRAREIGAALNIVSTEPGTTVSLSF